MDYSPNYYSFHSTFDVLHCRVYCLLQYKIHLQLQRAEYSCILIYYHSIWYRTWHIGVCSITVLWRIDQLLFIWPSYLFQMLRIWNLKTNFKQKTNDLINVKAQTQHLECLLHISRTPVVSYILGLFCGTIVTPYHFLSESEQYSQFKNLDYNWSL